MHIVHRFQGQCCVTTAKRYYQESEDHITFQILRQNNTGINMEEFREQKLVRINLRYFPPGLTLVYKNSYGKIKEKIFDLLDLHYGTDIPKLGTEILDSDPLFSTHKQKIFNCLEKLKEKTYYDYSKKYVALKMIKPHSLPLTDACISKDGMKCVTSSLGNACKIWCTLTGKEIGTLAGHKDAVTSVNINPTGDNILTSSYDGTVRNWSHREEDGYVYCNQVLGACENGKVLFSKYSLDYQMAISATDEKTICVHDLVNGVKMHRLNPEIKASQEVTSVNLDGTGKLLLASPHSGNEAAIWDLRSGEVMTILKGHQMEITKSIFNFTSDLVATSSIDSTVKVWDLRRLDFALQTLSDSGFDSEIEDIEFDPRGQKLLAGTGEGKLILWDLETDKTLYSRLAHKSPISKVCWSPNGAVVLTCSDHGIVRLYHSEMGTCLQTLPDHTREIVNASFNYSSEYLMTASKDKTVRIHKLTTL